MAGKLDAALDIILADPSGLGDLVEALAGEAGSEVDYQLEAHLEALTSALAGSASAAEESLGKRGKSMRDIAEAPRTVWLEGDVPRCGAELKVRAARRGPVPG